jgi:contactin associated protein-like 2
LTRGSYAKLRGYEGVKTMNVSFFFRTYEEKGMLMYHDFTSKGDIKLYLENGKVKIQLKTEDNQPIILDNYEEQFNDGRWHSLVLTMGKNSLTIDIDQRPMKTQK